MQGNGRSRPGWHILVIVAALAGCTESSPVTGPTRGTAAPESAHWSIETQTAQLLWDQVSTKTSIDITSGGTPVSVPIAADFVVPAATRWGISQLVLSGGAGQDNPSVQLELTIRADNGGVPGSVIWTQSLVPSSATEVLPILGWYDFTFDFAEVPLSSGTYWLIVECGHWFFRCSFAPVVGSAGYVLVGGQWIPNPYAEAFGEPAFALYGSATTPSSATEDLQSVLDGLGIPAGTTNSLQAKLRAVLDALEAGDTEGACRSLSAFVNEVSAQSGKKISTQEAAALLDAANAIADLLGC